MDDSSGSTEQITVCDYQYRDAANYRLSGRFVLRGAATAQEQERIWASLDPGAVFLPAQVGLGVLYEGWTSQFDDDHPWHELVSVEVLPGSAADQERVASQHPSPQGASTVAEFVALLEATTWDEEAAQAALQEWKATVPPGR